MDLKRDFSTKWITLDGDKYLIRYLPEELRQQIQNECTVDDELDVALFSERVIDHVLADWGDTIKSDGKKAKCSPENKKLFLTQNVTKAETLTTKALIPSFFHPDIKEILGNLTRPSDISDNGKEKKAEIVAD